MLMPSNNELYINFARPSWAKMIIQNSFFRALKQSIHLRKAVQIAKKGVNQKFNLKLKNYFWVV